MAGIVRVLARSSCLLRQTSALVSRRSNMTTKRIAYEEMQEFWVKNKQLARPLSPHLSIYGYHLTMVMSITNRVIGVAFTTVLLGGSCIMLVLPMDYKTIIQKVKDLQLNSAIIYGAKYVIATPFVYHVLCGMRHLLWDAGIGFNGPTVIKGGYSILVATAVLASAVVFGIKPSML